MGTGELPVMVLFSDPRYRHSYPELSHQLSYSLVLNVQVRTVFFIHWLLVFFQQPGESLLGGYRIHPPVYYVDADDDADDISYHITDAVIDPTRVGRHNYTVDCHFLELPNQRKEEREQCCLD